MSQKDMGMALSYSPQSVSLFEKGGSPIPASLIPSLADFLHCSIEDLLNANPNPGFDYENLPFDKEKFSMVISDIRTNMGKTQNEEAEALRISLRTIRNYEKGLSVPTTDFVYKFADYYNIEPARLFGPKKEQKSSELTAMVEKKSKSSRRKWIGIAIGASAIAVASIIVPVAVFLNSRTGTNYYNRFGAEITEDEFYSESLPELSIELESGRRSLNLGNTNFLLSSDDSTFFERHTEYDFTWSINASEPSITAVLSSGLGTRNGFAADITCEEDYLRYDYSLITVSLHLVDTYNNASYDLDFPYFVLTDGVVNQVDPEGLPGVTSFSLPFVEFGTSSSSYSKENLEYQTYTLSMVFNGTTTGLSEETFDYEIVPIGEQRINAGNLVTVDENDPSKCYLTITPSQSGNSFALLVSYRSSNGHLVYASQITTFSVI